MSVLPIRVKTEQLALTESTRGLVNVWKVTLEKVAPLVRRDKMQNT